MKTEDKKNSKPANAQEKAKLYRKIKETWGKLNDDDIKLYDGQRSRFLEKLKEKHKVSIEDGQKKLRELEKSCGCGQETKKVA